MNLTHFAKKEKIGYFCIKRFIMATGARLNVDINISSSQLVSVVRQLPLNKKKELISFLQEDEEKLALISGIKEAVEEVNLAKKGKVQLKSARAFLDEL